MSSSDIPDSLAGNIADWTKTNAEYTDARAPVAWVQEEITWGIWRIPESELHVLPNLEGVDVVDLGCGTGYFSAWLAKRGARPVGVDPTPAQLATARRMQRETGIEFPLVEAPGERVPLPDASFDLALSEYGAALWAVPERWLAEAARLLRPGGLLVFLTNSVLNVLCMPDDPDAVAQEQLQRPQFGMYAFHWEDQQGVEYHLPHGEWIRLLREQGFEVEALHELQAPEDAQIHSYYSYVTAEWGRKWPAEELWKARKR
jgi:ubiquinone/menaquinone biosynthesis C-methylase UbiE